MIVKKSKFHKKSLDINRYHVKVELLVKAIKGENYERNNLGRWKWNKTLSIGKKCIKINLPIYDKPILYYHQY